MGAEKKEQGKKCFIITPIGNESSDMFRKAKGVIESVIKPVLEKHGFDDIKPAYEILESGMINNQIINRIINDDLVVANLTGNNPNVMYELAIRHAAAKPIIHICENGTILPFDIKDSRTIFYTDDMLGVQELNRGFENFVAGISYSNEYKDNPIYNAMQMGILLHKMDSEGRGTDAYLLQKILDEISSIKVKNINFDKNYKDENLGFYVMNVEVENLKIEDLNILQTRISDDISISLADVDNKKNVKWLYITNNVAYSERGFVSMVKNILEVCKIDHYTIRIIQQIK